MERLLEGGGECGGRGRTLNQKRSKLKIDSI